MVGHISSCLTVIEKFTTFLSKRKMRMKILVEARGDDLDPSVGMLNGVILGILFWGAVIAIVKMV